MKQTLRTIFAIKYLVGVFIIRSIELVLFKEDMGYL